jgi:hypothetical protein
VWDVATGKEQHRLGDHREPVWAVAVSPNGHWILSAGGIPTEGVGQDHAIRRWRMPARQ